MFMRKLRPRHSRRIPIGVMGLLVLVAGFPTGRGADDVPQLLRTYCIGCHNNIDREGGVSLLSAAAIQEGSEHGSLLDKADINNSRLLMVLASNAELAMPPVGEPQPSPEEREVLRQWVLKGAPLSTSIAKPSVPEIAAYRQSIPILSSVRVTNEEVCLGAINRIDRLNPTDGKLVWTAQGEFGKVTRLAVSSDGRWIVAACGIPGVGGQAVLLDAEDGQEIHRFSGHADAVYAAVLDAGNSRLATAGYDRRILIHDVETGRVLRTLSGHNGSVFDLSFDPSGQVLCSASADATVKVWSVQSGERLDTLSQPQSEQYCVAVTPDGQSIVAAGADNRIRVWSLVSLDTLRINPLQSSTFGHEQTITSLALSNSGDRLATAAEDGSLRIWSIHPFTQLATFPEQDSLVTSVMFLNDHQLLITRLDGSWKLLSVPDSNPRSSEVSRQPAVLPRIDMATELTEIQEVEANDTAQNSQQVTLPVRVRGTIDRDGEADHDCFRFSAKAGQTVLLDIVAAGNDSPLDSVIEVLSESGKPVLRTKLQALRDSWFTFRGKNSDTSDDFRLFYWREMELNDFLYADGEVVRLWHYPRGPDSGFRVYPGFGARHAWFDTTPTSHAMLAPCYIVVPRDPDEKITPNGLPVFPIYYRNDDDPQRVKGSDSRLFFTAPVDGQWTARVTDARGFQGADYSYQLEIRLPQPGFHISFNTRKLEMAAGTGRELEFNAERVDGFSGAITIRGYDLPPGFALSGPAVIEEHQLRARVSLFAKRGAATPTEDQLSAVRFIATAEILGQEVTETLTGLEELKLLESSKLFVHIESETGRRTAENTPLQLQIRPGETIRAFIRLERIDTDAIVSFGKEDAGRSLPHGVYVANTGLSGLLLPAGTNEREFFIAASPVVPPGNHHFFLKANIDGITSLPVALEILPPASSGGTVATSQ
ncbi:MAG: hypothetical protein MK102_09905 [Fuerstiella sp.]|nr:hypothetical protein [Fuerstiella sp.]